MNTLLHKVPESQAIELPALETSRMLTGFASLISAGKLPEKKDVLFALALSRELRNQAYIGQSLYYLAQVFLADENPRQSLIILDEAKKLLAGEDKPLVMLQCLELTGKVYQSLEDCEMALGEYFSALEIINENLSLEYCKGSLHHKIGMAFKSTRDFDNAVSHFRKYLHLSEKYKQSNDIAQACFELGNMLTLSDEYAEAAVYLRKSQEMAFVMGNKHLELFALVTRAILKTRLRQFKKAMALFEEAETGILANGNEEIKAHLLRSKAKLFIDMELYPEALQLLDEARMLAEKLKLNQVLLMVYKFYTVAHEAMGKFQSALEFNKLHFNLEKKILEDRSKTRVHGLQMKFQMEEVLKENEIFKLKNVVLQQANDKILQQKNKIEAFHTELTSSLTYASKIQRAILPLKEEISETLPGHFVFWKPRDVVSGDFYWHFNAKTHTYIAAADCTGHGVPGAFMSMISNTILNEVVGSNPNLSPAEILTMLNLEIKKALKQDLGEKESHDGLDIALCKIDNTSGVITFSGANRPLYLVKKGADEITEIKSDKGSIGGMHSHNDRFFAQHSIQLEKGDRVYLFTDGITDQFGEDTNKKLRPVNFRTWVMESAGIPFDELEHYYAGKLAEWQKEENQTDDILVMGFGL